LISPHYYDEVKMGRAAKYEQKFTPNRATYPYLCTILMRITAIACCNYATYKAAGKFTTKNGVFALLGFGAQSETGLARCSSAPDPTTTTTTACFSFLVAAAAGSSARCSPLLFSPFLAYCSRTALQ